MKKIASVVLIGFVFVLLAGCVVGQTWKGLGQRTLEKERASVRMGARPLEVEGLS